MDDSEFVDSDIPFRGTTAWENVPRFYVNFRKACLMHDAGYSGAKTADAMSGYKTVDLFTKTKTEIDQRFLDDMQRLCDEQISDKAKVARANCKSYGGFHSTSGAQSRWQVVDKGGPLI